MLQPAASTTARPNFLVIGAAKSATTTLWHYLRQHARISVSSRKHTRFFAFDVEEPGFRGLGPKNPSVPTDPFGLARTQEGG